MPFTIHRPVDTKQQGSTLTENWAPELPTIAN